MFQHYALSPYASTCALLSRPGDRLHGGPLRGPEDSDRPARAAERPLATPTTEFNLSHIKLANEALEIIRSALEDNETVYNTNYFDNQLDDEGATIITKL